MATIADLGKRVKAKHPGQYDDLDDIILGQKVKAKFPGDYDDFEDVQRPTPGDVEKRFRNYAPATDWRDRPWTEFGRGAVDTLKGIGESVVPKNWGEAALNVVGGPLAVPAYNMLRGHVDQARQAMDPNRPGLERAGHALATITPGGPFAAQIGETLPDNPPRAAGIVAGGVATAALPALGPKIPQALSTTGKVLSGAARGATNTKGWQPGAVAGAAAGYEFGGPHGAAIGTAIGGGLPAVRGAIQGGLEAYRGRNLPPHLRGPIISGKGTGTKYGGPTAPFDEGAGRLAPRQPAILPEEPPPPPYERFKPGSKPTPYGGSTPPFDEGAGRLPPRNPAMAEAESLVPQPESSIPNPDRVVPNPRIQRQADRFRPGDEPSSVSYRNRPRTGRNRSVEELRAEEALKKKDTKGDKKGDIEFDMADMPEQHPVVTKPSGIKPNIQKAASDFAESQGAKPGEPLVIPQKSGIEAKHAAILKNVVDKVKRTGVTPESLKEAAISLEKRGIGPEFIEDALSELKRGDFQFAKGSVVLPKLLGGKKAHHFYGRRSPKMQSLKGLPKPPKLPEPFGQEPPPPYQYQENP